MPNRRIIKARDLAGIFIYQDPKQGTIFYDIFSRKGYILTSSDVKTYSLYTTIFPLSIIVAFGAMSLFNLNYLVTAIVFALAYLLGALAFRFMFFYKLPEAKNWKPVKKESIFLYLARGYSVTRLVILICLLIALSILMPIYANVSGYQGINLYGSYLVGAAALLGAIITIISLILKLKNNY
ncbi:MAG: hypothetical protein IJI46_08585 [Erysipelotrichaceae bacterium]|nr:hypothetical protein [Erysipelotrichaceae bacterium]